MKKFFLNLAVCMEEQRAETFRKALRRLDYRKIRRMLENGFNPNRSYRMTISERDEDGFKFYEVEKSPLGILVIDWMNGIFSKKEERMRKKSSMQDVYALIKSYGGK